MYEVKAFQLSAPSVFLAIKLEGCNKLFLRFFLSLQIRLCFQNLLLIVRMKETVHMSIWVQQKQTLSPPLPLLTIPSVVHAQLNPLSSCFSY